LKNNMKPIIETKKLNVTYFKGQENEIRALKNIDIQIYPGEFVIFYGPSGCGKSTILYSIAGLERHMEGEITINGVNYMDFSEKDFEKLHQEEMGMIFQAYYLIPSMSVIDNVLLPQVAMDMEKKKRQKRGSEVLKYFNIEAQANKMPQELSGGQQQRVAISRAIINDPNIILADEPVGNLDSKSASDVMELFKQLNIHQKKTIIMVTHDPSRLDIADRVFYIKDGYLTDTKVNKAKYYRPTITDEISKDFKQLSKTHKAITSIENDLDLEDYKSKNLALEVLTGLSYGEFEVIQNHVDKLLNMEGAVNYNEMYNFFDKNSREGGLDMDVRKAKKLMFQLKDMVEVIKQLKNGKLDINEEVSLIRKYIFGVFNINIEDEKVLKIVNKVIFERLQNKIDMIAVQVIFDLPFSEGGVGLDIRVAHKVSKRLELLILGKYKIVKPSFNKI